MKAPRWSFFLIFSKSYPPPTSITMDSFTCQPIINDASDKILVIMKTKVLQPVGKNASQVDVWHEAIDDIRTQLVRLLQVVECGLQTNHRYKQQVIRPLAAMAHNIPLYAVAADIQLAGWTMAKGWPNWSSIVGLDVSGNPDHPWLAIGGQVPTQSKPSSGEDISLDEVPIVATKPIPANNKPADRKGKGKQKSVAREEDQETQMEVDDSPPPPTKPIAKKAATRGRSRAPSSAPSAMAEDEEEVLAEDTEAVAEGPCATCAQRETPCTPRPGKACLQCNRRKVKCSLAPQRGRSVTRSQPPPPPSTKPKRKAPSSSLQPTEDPEPPKGSKDSDMSMPRSKSKGHRGRSRQLSPDVLRAPIKLKIQVPPQSKKRDREGSPSVERQSRKARSKSIFRV